MEKKLESVLRDFEYHAREAVNAIQDKAAAQKVAKDAERRIAKLRREFREQFDSTVVAHASGADQGDPHAEPQVVKYVSRRRYRQAEIHRPRGNGLAQIDDSHFEVAIGAMKMKIARDDIAAVITTALAADSPVKARGRAEFPFRSKTKARTRPRRSTSSATTSTTPRAKCRSSSTAHFLAGLPRVRVVHGSGMGILRKALRQALQQHPHVESVAEPPQNEGGGGATVVELRV